jgi:hypothetical protein
MKSYKKDWDWVFSALKDLPGKEDEEAEVRSVMVHTPNGWSNYATYLYVPASRLVEGIMPLDQCRSDSLAMMRKRLRLHSIDSIDALLGEITKWDDIAYSHNLSYELRDFHVDFHGKHNYLSSSPVWTFGFDDATAPSIPDSIRGPILEHEFPLYGSLEEAAADWLRDSSIKQNNRPSHSYRFLLALSQAILDDLDLKQGKLTIHIHSLASLSGIYLKLSSKSPDGSVHRQNKRAATRLDLEIPNDIQELTLYLVDDEGNPHDHYSETQFRSSWPQPILEGGRLTERPRLLDHIRKGEGVTIEFKEWIPIPPDDKKRWDIHKTTVAFVNTKGGSVLIGVDDNGEIVGITQNLRKIYGKAMKGDISAMARAYEKDLRRIIVEEVAPEIDMEFEILHVGEYIVMVIHVEQGSDPCWIVPTRETFIRRGATNTKATPEEIIQLHEERSRTRRF